MAFIHAIKLFFRLATFHISKKCSITSTTSWYTYYSLNHDFIQTTILSTNHWAPKKYITMEPPTRTWQRGPDYHVSLNYCNQHFILFIVLTWPILECLNWEGHCHKSNNYPIQNEKEAIPFPLKRFISEATVSRIVKKKKNPYLYQSYKTSICCETYWSSLMWKKTQIHMPMLNVKSSLRNLMLQIEAYFSPFVLPITV